MASPLEMRSADGAIVTPSSFNSISLARLRSYLGKDAVYQAHKDRFDTADFAWFVAGASRDNRHALPPNTFHTMWENARCVAGMSNFFLTRECYLYLGL